MLDLFIGFSSLAIAGVAHLVNRSFERRGREAPTPVVIAECVALLIAAGAFGIAFPILGFMNLGAATPTWRPTLAVVFSVILASAIAFFFLYAIGNRLIRSEEQARVAAIIIAVIILIIAVIMNSLFTPPSAYIITSGNTTTVLL